MNRELEPFRIACARPADLDEALRVVRACADGLRKMGLDQWDDLYPSREILEADVAAGSLYVMKEGERCLAIACLDEHQDPTYEAVAWAYDHPRIVSIHRLSVDPAVQGKGLARRMMDFLEEKAADLGYGVIRLDAYEKNPAALGLYAKRGYRRSGVVRLRKGLFACFEKRLAASPPGP